MDFADPSNAAYTEAPSTVLALQQNLESLETEKQSLRDKIGELEVEIRHYQQNMHEKDEYITRQQREIDELKQEREQASNMTMDQQIGGIMGGIRNISEMEAIINFKEKEIEELRMNSNNKVQDLKAQKAQLKQELEFEKEKVLRLKQAEIERDLFK